MVRAPGLGGCRGGGGHVLGRGVPPGHAARPCALTWPGTGVRGWRTEAGALRSPVGRLRIWWLSRCRRGGGLQTQAARSHGLLPNFGPASACPTGNHRRPPRPSRPPSPALPRSRHPRRGGPAGSAATGSDPPEGTCRSRGPAHRSRGPAHASPQPRPPLPGSSPSCRLAQGGSPPASARSGAHCSPRPPRPACLPAPPARAVRKPGARERGSAGPGRPHWACSVAGAGFLVASRKLFALHRRGGATEPAALPCTAAAPAPARPGPAAGRDEPEPEPARRGVSAGRGGRVAQLLLRTTPPPPPPARTGSECERLVRAELPALGAGAGSAGHAGTQLKQSVGRPAAAAPRPDPAPPARPQLRRPPWLPRSCTRYLPSPSRTLRPPPPAAPRRPSPARPRPARRPGSAAGARFAPSPSAAAVCWTGNVCEGSPSHAAPRGPAGGGAPRTCRAPGGGSGRGEVALTPVTCSD